MKEIYKSKRILVIGCPGSGKTTLSKKLNKKLKLPLIHLDKFYHKPNWVEPEKTEWKKIVERLAKKPTWIMDGNYADSFDIRFSRADTVIYLDYTSIKCFYRVIKRVIFNYGLQKSDMAEGCKESLDISFLKFVLLFNYNNRDQIYERIKILDKSKKILIFKKDKEVMCFLVQLTNNSVP